MTVGLQRFICTLEESCSMCKPRPRAAGSVLGCVAVVGFFEVAKVRIAHLKSLGSLAVVS